MPIWVSELVTHQNYKNTGHALCFAVEMRCGRSSKALELKEGPPLQLAIIESLGASKTIWVHVLWGKKKKKKTNGQQKWWLERARHVFEKQDANRKLYRLPTSSAPPQR